MEDLLQGNTVLHRQVDTVVLVDMSNLRAAIRRNNRLMVSRRSKVTVSRHSKATASLRSKVTVNLLKDTDVYPLRTYKEVVFRDNRAADIGHSKGITLRLLRQDTEDGTRK